MSDETEPPGRRFREVDDSSDATEDAAPETPETGRRFSSDDEAGETETAGSAVWPARLFRFKQQEEPEPEPVFGPPVVASETPEPPAEEDEPAARENRSLVAWLLFVASIACWGYSVTQIDASDLTRLGLVGALPIAYFLALIFVTSSFVATLVSKKPSNVLLGLNVMLLITIIHGTAPLVFDEPRYAWAYKHFGVTEHIMNTGEVDPTVDIYQNWPGFFALAAWFGEASGLGIPRNYAAWAQLFHNALAFALLGFLYRSLTGNMRVIWLSLFLFFATSWVAQDYFAPQALVFLLMVGVFGVIAKWLLNPEPHGPLYRLTARILHARKRDVVEATSPWRVNRTPGSQATWALAAAALVFFVIASSHQLSPFLVLCGVGGLMVMSQLKEKATFFLLAAVAFVYLLPHLPFVQDQYGILSDLNPLSNARNASVEQVSQSEMMEFVALCARGLSVFVWAMAVLGFFRGLWQGRRDLVAAILMVAPFAVIFGQSYGGEAIYRVYLFSLPFAAFLAARFVLPKMDRAFAVRFMRPFVPITLCLALMMPAYFGLEGMNEIPTGEADASAYFYEEAPRGSLLVTVVASFPMRSKGTYDEYQLPAGGDIAPSLSTISDFEEYTVSTDRLLTLLEGTMRNTAGVEKYAVISRGQQRATDLLDIGPPTMMADLETAMKASPNWEVAYSNDVARLYRFVDRAPEAGSQ